MNGPGAIEALKHQGHVAEAPEIVKSLRPGEGVCLEDGTTVYRDSEDPEDFQVGS